MRRNTDIQDFEVSKEVEERIPRLAGFVSIYGVKASALLAYENRYEPEDAPRMI